jgi:hypothetical protein
MSRPHLVPSAKAYGTALWFGFVSAGALLSVVFLLTL